MTDIAPASHRRRHPPRQKAARRPAETTRQDPEARIAAAIHEAREKGGDPASVITALTEMRDQDLAALSTRSKVSAVQVMVEHLQPPGTSLKQPWPAEMTAALIRLWRNTDLDPAFARWQQERIERLGDALRDDRRLEQARRRWPTLSTDRRIAVLNHVAETQMRIMGGTPVPMVPFHQPAGGGLIRHARYEPDHNRVGINTADGSALHNFTQAVVTVLHETSHALQDQWAEALDRKQVKPDSPLYLQTLLFDLNMEQAGYIPSALNFDAYQAQPVENHAEGFALAVARRIASPERTPRLILQDADRGPTEMGAKLLEATESFLRRPRP